VAVAHDRNLSTSVARAFDLLDAIAASGRDGMTLAELAATVTTAKSTTHRYVSTLLELGALRRGADGRLRLGLRLIELAGAMLEGDNLRHAAEPVLHDVMARTGETVHLGVPGEGMVVYVAKVESAQSVRLVSRIGARVPFHSSAMGKALLACMDAAELEAELARPREVRTIRTITARGALEDEIARIRERGYAVDDEENEAGVRCVGAAVVNGRGRALAALSVSAPASRMPLERCAEVAPVVRSAAAEIARRLGVGAPA
jgi:DNA-binding IclR family transcriptional regulator